MFDSWVTDTVLHACTVQVFAVLRTYMHTDTLDVCHLHTIL